MNDSFERVRKCPLAVAAAVSRRTIAADNCYRSAFSRRRLQFPFSLFIDARLRGGPSL